MANKSRIVLLAVHANNVAKIVHFTQTQYLVSIIIHDMACRITVLGLTVFKLLLFYWY